MTDTLTCYSRLNHEGDCYFTIKLKFCGVEMKMNAFDRCLKTSTVVREAIEPVLGPTGLDKPMDISSFPPYPPRYPVGSHVEKTKGDYVYGGTVVSTFRKLSGVLRYVVEDHRGLLFIFNERQLEWSSQ